MRRALVYALAGLLLGAGPATLRAAEVMPLEDVRPGMRGVGRTVFEGSRVDEFDVTILGVMYNTGPRQSIILAKLEGGPLAETGVIAGMSGSPVYIDGKLVGAVAYGFPFSKDTIAGLTPIGEMIQATLTDAPRAVSARFPVPETLTLPLDAETFVAALERHLPDVAVPMSAGGGVPGGALRPLALPMSLSGFTGEAFETARRLFAPWGFTPVMGSGPAGLPDEPLPDLEPGGAVGVSLIEGDLDLSVTGTITEIDDGRVYAFGHPFYNLGPTQFPMKKAYVYSVFPSLYQSWKIATAADPVGTMDQDRVAAIAGRIGETPRMIPIEVSLKTSRGAERQYSYRIVEDELFSPALAYVSLLSVLQANERAFGTATVRVNAEVGIEGRESVRVSDLYAANQPSLRAAALTAAPLVYLMSNSMESVVVSSIKVELESFETVHSASLERVWLERAGPVRPGSRVDLKLTLRTWRGETQTETVPISVPANAPEGNYALVVADGSLMTAIEQRELRQAFVPRDLGQLIRAINGLRQNDRLYVRLLRRDPGAIVEGEYLQALPPSVLQVLGGNASGGGVTQVSLSSVWDFELPLDQAVSGLRRLALTIER